MIVAPATASTLAKMACGVADNMLITSYLSSRAPVFVAPAMDLDMMAHPTTTRNLATLKADGVRVIEPETGELASHLVGRGRMEEPERIVEVLDGFFGQDLPLKGKKVMITAGPTYERIDPVRFIGNFWAERGGVRTVHVESAAEMLDECLRGFDSADISIMAAAVADYAPRHYVDHKIKREHDDVDVIEVIKNPDIAATLGSRKRPGQVLVGFALETDNAEANGREKPARKNLDFIVVNSLADQGAGFGTDTNKVTVISHDAEHSFPLKSKTEVASDILDCISAGL